MTTSSEQRPDTDLLLAKVKREEAEAQRGKLRIYFGSSAGVGKTYAMLVARRKLKADGRDIVIGFAEAHGPSETMALLADLEVVPPKAPHCCAVLLRSWSTSSRIRMFRAYVIRSAGRTSKNCSPRASMYSRR